MTTWTDAPLVALDLEGSGAQDRDDEAILEIAVVPINGGQPSLPDAFAALINPGRPIPRRPWISPGLTSSVLASAPLLAEVTAELAARINGKIVVGHNVGVDWRLLRRRCPDIRPQALIDTLRLARHVNPGVKGNALGALLDRYGLTAEVTSLVPASQPHRALWDTAGTALLLPALIDDLTVGSALTLAELLHIAGLPAEAAGIPAEGQAAPGQASLFDV
jgi:DNA polymerase-3 subunit epsilon/exodeoxyribonuclease X